MLQLVGEIHNIQAMILLVCPTLENSTSRQAVACRTLMRQIYCPSLVSKNGLVTAPDSSS